MNKQVTSGLIDTNEAMIINSSVLGVEKIQPVLVSVALRALCCLRNTTNFLRYLYITDTVTYSIFIFWFDTIGVFVCVRNQFFKLDVD